MFILYRQFYHFEVDYGEKTRKKLSPFDLREPKKSLR